MEHIYTNGHVETYQDGKFLYSSDTLAEAVSESLEEDKLQFRKGDVVAMSNHTNKNSMLCVVTTTEHIGRNNKRIMRIALLTHIMKTACIEMAVKRFGSIEADCSLFDVVAKEIYQ